ncbi:hypothetical protein EPI10_022297 [Gossypium australe]|uniref:Uncharacterized protein n=1 Tax=Gossypium australe TaxID=47621 RepID=A0A5B6WJ93_9ROSI|nr:hypothetical protein EPI10_022297 [Gossypium australe]
MNILYNFTLKLAVYYYGSNYNKFVHVNKQKVNRHHIFSDRDDYNPFSSRYIFKMTLIVVLNKTLLEEIIILRFPQTLGIFITTHWKYELP